MSYPAIPKNPITLTINGWLMDNYLKYFFKTFLPEYEFIVTSGYRSEDKQKEMKESGLNPAEFSAHLYNFARDYVITKNGRMLTDIEMNHLFQSRIKPNWEGYTYFAFKTKNTNTGWIHGNIVRDHTKITGMIGLLAGIGGALYTGKKIYNKLKK